MGIIDIKGTADKMGHMDSMSPRYTSQTSSISHMNTPTRELEHWQPLVTSS